MHLCVTIIYLSYNIKQIKTWVLFWCLSIFNSIYCENIAFGEQYEEPNMYYCKYSSYKKIIFFTTVLIFILLTNIITCNESLSIFVGIYWIRKFYTLPTSSNLYCFGGHKRVGTILGNRHTSISLLTSNFRNPLSFITYKITYKYKNNT